MDPLEHYVHSGANSGYAPGPLFDPADFLKRHPDIAALGRRPLLWFLEPGPNEQRYAQSVHSEPEEDRWGPCTPLPIIQNTSRHPSIAVAVHVFYLDVFEEICSYLKNFPCNFNLLVTTPIAAHVEAIEKLVERSGLKTTLFVKVGQNRGRNFAPFLVEFSDLIQKHDLFLHLHTKKSLHNGPAAAEWRSHLYKSLLGSKYLINSFIELFGNEDLGVLYPATHYWLPYWAHHWLSNSHLIEPFYRRISLPYSRPLEYIDFPVGSMFWARPRALKPLFDARWTYEDFPSELGQNDGTVAHVIERSIVTIARSQGYGFIEFDYRAGSLRHNWSRKNLYQYSHRTKQDLYRGIEAADVVSFDIFDTLVTRMVLTPDSLQKYTGWLLSHQVPGLENFFRVRKHAEELARRKKNFKEDVNLDEIYDEFPSEGSWTSQNLALAKQLELACESRAFNPRADMVEAAKYARSLGKRIIAVSDTYFSREFVEKLLQQFEILDLFDEIYLSSVRGVRKDRGDMWDFLVTSEELHSKRLLHIGDNEHSDAQLPGDRRLGIFHVMSPVALMVNAGISVPVERNWSADLALGPVAARFFNSPFLPDRRFRPLRILNAEDLGYAVFGPLFFGFFSWLFTHPVVKSLTHLYFLSREGFFLHKLYLKLQEILPPISVPATYLYASRRAMIAAGQGVKFDPSQITFGSGFRGSIAELLKARLGLILPAEFELGHTNILLPNDVNYVGQVLNILKPYIVEHGGRELEGLRQYCRENGMMDAEKIGLIDIGYSGSIQNALQTVLDKSLVGLYIATTQDVSRVEGAGGFAFGCFADRETFAETACPVLRHCRILESFLTAPHGQVLRFEVNGGRATPTFKSGGLSQFAFRTLKEVFKGVDEYFDDLIRSFGPEVLLSSPNLQIAQLPLRALVEHNMVLPATLVDALYLEDEFCGNAELRAGNLAREHREHLQPA
ncbi:MAG TPA: rhamnan synthesis F family protein [Bryobacteraceae bacterium]|nr:rhamnan synthesis F family protein [Bryobacteraceae bacterium]